jgi:hypothetical protein
MEDMSMDLSNPKTASANKDFNKDIEILETTSPK